MCPLVHLNSVIQIVLVKSAFVEKKMILGKYFAIVADHGVFFNLLLSILLPMFGDMRFLFVYFYLCSLWKHETL